MNGCVCVPQDNFEAKWSAAVQEKHDVLQEKIELEGKIAELETALAAKCDKLRQCEERCAELDENLGKTSTMLEQAMSKLKSIEDASTTPQAVLTASNCMLNKHHDILSAAFEEQQLENRTLRQELSSTLLQLTESQESRREAEESRGRLEHEIHRLSRLRGEAEMARSDAERHLREFKLGTVNGTLRLDGLGSLSSGSPRKTKRSASLRKARTQVAVRRLVR